MRIEIKGGVGNIVKGHVLDSAPKYVERALKDYDPQLYVRWSPDIDKAKHDNMGIWEIRRRPNQKEIKEKIKFNGVTFSILDYVELDHIHGILKTPVLNYQIVEKIKEMDTWNKDHWLHSLEYDERQQYAKEYDNLYKERKYMVSQNRKLARDMKELIATGVNPARILKYWS